MTKLELTILNDESVEGQFHLYEYLDMDAGAELETKVYPRLTKMYHLGQLTAELLREGAEAGGILMHCDGGWEEYFVTAESVADLYTPTLEGTKYISFRGTNGEILEIADLDAWIIYISVVCCNLDCPIGELTDR
ncbi:hypothetical protein GR28A_00074 [Vibrio phage vB_VcorM_GR28A]|nr:hypothetical protein GR28A_00074 [Vibrio phage vB_VcorM_GR28A]